MSAEPQSRFQTGEVCAQTGHYSFDGYVDGGWQPPPHFEEMTVELAVGEPFPRIRSVGKPCWWVPLDEVEFAETAAQQMTSEGAPAAPGGAG